MTQVMDDVTAMAISLMFFLMALILFEEAGHTRRRRGLFFAGLAAILVTIVYAMPVIFHVPVNDIRDVLRFALIIYASNYIISYYDVLLTLFKRMYWRVRGWTNSSN